MMRSVFNWFVRTALLGLVCILSVSICHAQQSPNELFPNGDFTDANASPPLAEGKADVVEMDGSRALRLTRRLVYAWDAPEKIIGGAEYIFSCRVKSVRGAAVLEQNMHLHFWARLPVMHEPPAGGSFPVAFWSGNFDWKRFEKRFRMPNGVSRFMFFFNTNVPGGEAYIDDLSLRPADDAPLPLEPSAPTYGNMDREQMTWIWNEAAFPWRGVPRRNGPDMGRDAAKAVPRQEVWFRRTIAVPAGVKNARATFVGDDAGLLTVNGREAGANAALQDVVSVPLASFLKAGTNEIVWKVSNIRGPGGLLGRIEWQDMSGATRVFPTNDRWECSSDSGANWRPAAQVAVPPPASTQNRWAYPHLPLSAYTLTYDLPAGVTTARVAVRGPGSFRVLADGKELGAALCAGYMRKLDLGEAVGGAKQLTVSLEDVAQPAFGAGVLQLKVGDQWRIVPFAELKHEGRAPQPVQGLISTYSWPVNSGAFEAAASRSVPDLRGRLEPWAAELLADSKPIFQLGTDDDSSAEFGEVGKGVAATQVPVADSKSLPRGLEGKLQPELKLNFNLAAEPANGAAFVLDVEDADALVTSLGIFVNGILCGMPQVLGYDQFPGERLTNRAWVVTIPRERLRAGVNEITLRLLPSCYSAGAATENQSEEYIQMIGLGDRARSPYKSAWLHWDTLGLRALGHPLTRPVNGRPVHMGTNLGLIAQEGIKPWREFVLRDLSYLGLTGTGAPIRYAVWTNAVLAPASKFDPSLPSDKTLGELQLRSLQSMGARPFLLLEPGRGLPFRAEVEASREAIAVRQLGRFVDMMEIGNEVDEPYYGWNSLKLADAYATIQRQAASGQMLKKLDPDQNLKITGQGWYHAWDFSVVDAQARQESPEDTAWTDELATHNYSKSYIISAVGYYLLYGVNPPKPIWSTECGSWSADKEAAAEFDANLRGNIAFSTNIVQYLAHPYNEEAEHFSLFSAKNKDARIMERARSYRRLVHAFSLEGKPLAWRYADPESMRDKLVMVNPVDADKWIKVSFINFSHEPQAVDVTVSLPLTGAFQATRYGDAETVAAATREVTLQAGPESRFQEALAPGETVEYLIARP